MGFGESGGKITEEGKTSPHIAGYSETSVSIEIYYPRTSLWEEGSNLFLEISFKD